MSTDDRKKKEITVNIFFCLSILLQSLEEIVLAKLNAKKCLMLLAEFSGKGSDKYNEYEMMLPEID